MIKLKKSTKHSTFAIIMYYFLLLIIFNGAVTFAWFSSQLTNLEGVLNLGELAATVKIYENHDDSLGGDDYIDGLTDEVAIESNSSSATTYDLIQKPWYSNEYTSIYLEVENTGTIDLKSILRVYYDNSNLLNFLSYYYYQLVDITNTVNTYALPTTREQLSAYNSDFQDDIAENVPLYINNVINNGNSIASSLAVINMGTTVYQASSFYRLDVALSEIPTELLTQFNNLPVEEREIKINAVITLKQTNAPDGDDDDDSGLSVYVSTSDAFINAVNSAINGDTVYLTTNIAISRNVTITKRVNIVLNGFTLTISGNLAYDIAGSGTTRLDVSNSSVLYVLGNLIIDTPNSTFKILGSGSSAQSIILGNGTNPSLGDFYVNALKDDNKTETYGYYQYGVAIMRRATQFLLTHATMRVDSNTRVSIGLGSTTGQIVSVSGASNIEVYNYGEIQDIDFSNMTQLAEAIVQIYIYNSNKFSTTEVAIMLPSWSLGWKSKELQSISNAVNTRVINAPGSNTIYSVDGSLVFLDIDIENVDIAADAVIHLGEYDYRVNIQLDSQGQDTNTVYFYLRGYYYNNNNDATEPQFEAWLTTIKSLYLYTYNTAVVKVLDFTFMKNYTTSLETLDLSFSNIENSAIPDSAFYNRTSLQYVYFPIDELSIGTAAFYGTSLDTVTLSSTIVTIGADAFNVNTASNGPVKIFYQSETVTSLLNYITSLTPDKTLLFMSPSNLISFKSNYSVTDTWYINSYAKYDFVDEFSNYYQIIDGDSVEVVYYGGAWGTLNIFNTVVYNAQSYRVVGIAQSAYRRSINAAGATPINISLPNNVTYIRGDVFYNAYINNLNLNNVRNIGAYAFFNASILTSSARPLSFSSMTAVGAYAFANSKIGTIGTTSLVTFELANTTGGVINNTLDLRGTYSLGLGVFNSASFYGVALILENVNGVYSNMTNNLSLYGSELHLKNVGQIGDSAFEAKFKSYTALYPYNKVFVQEVKTIGTLAFKGMYLDEFVIGVKTLYVTQASVNNNVSYGGTVNGMIYSDFRATNLTIDGMLPQISSGKATFIFGTETVGRIYNNVTIKNTSGLLYGFMFYGTSDVNAVTITNLHLYDIDEVEEYALYHSNITNIYSYSGETLLDNASITSVAEYAFRYSSLGSLGNLTLSNVETYAFADSFIPATSTTINGTVGDYAFYNSNTTGMQTISLTGIIGNYVFSNANIHTVTSIYISGVMGQYMFQNARIYDCTSIEFANMIIEQNTFIYAIIYSAATISTSGVSNVLTRAFYNLVASTSTINLTNALTIQHEALRKINVQTVRLGNTTFHDTMQNNFVYGTSLGGIFTKNDVSTITNLYIDGELPDQRFGTHVLGADGANITITNIYITQACTTIPNYMFYSTNVSGRLIISNFYIQSPNLTIGEYAFGSISIANVIYDAATYDEISFSGEYAFYFANIGNFTDFVYYDAVELKDTTVLKEIANYTFQYVTFAQNSDLSLFEYATSIGNYAFDHVTFVATSGGDNVSFDLTRVPTIGHSIFKDIYNPLGTLTLGNSAYYDAYLSTYYYGNPLGDEGIFGNSGTVEVEHIIIAGNLPDSNVTGLYQTRALGLSGAASFTIELLTIQAAVTKLPSYGFSGYNIFNRNNIETLDIYSTSLIIGNSTFAYTDITSMNIYSSSIELKSKSFEYSLLRDMNYDRTSGVGAITFNSTAEYTFQYSTIYVMTGFTSTGTGVIQSIGTYAFYNTTFAMDCDISFIDYVGQIKNNAFMYATFTKTSLDENVDINLSGVVTIGEEIFAYIPISIGTLTLGNSTYEAIYEDDYSYGSGVNGVLYAAGRIDILNIAGNLPNINSYNMLGNSHEDDTWSVNYGVVNIASVVTSIPSSAFISELTSASVTIDTLNINSTSLSIGTSAFYNAEITTINSNATTITFGTNSFKYNLITTLNLDGTTINLGNSAFANSQITNINYIGTTSGAVNMTGASTFANTTITVMSGFTYTISTINYSIIKNISNNAFEGAVFAQDCNISWIQYVDSIGSYAFSTATFTKTSGDDYIDLNLTRVLTIGANAFYRLQQRLGIVTLGNNSYSANPAFAYGNGNEGIFNNSGIIEHLIIAEALPTTANALGNKASNVLHLTTYGIVEIQAGITSLPNNLFAGSDTVYSTIIGSLYIYPTNITIGNGFLYNTVVTNLYIPNTTTFNGVGANAFRNSDITNISVTNTLTIMGYVNDYAFHSFDFTGVTLNVQSVSYIGEYAFAYVTYSGSLTFNSAIELIDAEYAFASANISGHLTFNSVRSLGSNLFNGIISGTAVTYTFNFEEALQVTSDYAFAFMNGGGTVYVIISGLPTLNSYRAFYNSTNIVTIVFDEDLINLNADNVFENASNLISIAFNNTLLVTVVNSTITTMPAQVKVYVPGNLLADYLMDTYWSLIMSQISTTYNLDSTNTWGFYILGATYTANLVKYLGSSTSLTIPATITYNSQSYDVLALGPSLLTGTLVTELIIPRTIQNVDMDLFSNSNIEDVSFTGTGVEPFYIDTDLNGNKVIYESSEMLVLYKYLPSNTSTSYVIKETVIEIAEKAFYRNHNIESITFIAGTIQTGNINGYTTTYAYNLTLAQYAISECNSLTTVHMQNNSSGFGVLFASYAISSNPALTNLYIRGYSSIINSYSIYNNDALVLIELVPATSEPYGNKGKVYSNIAIEPYAFFGSGSTTQAACIYTTMYQNYIFSRAFANSRITLFEFDVDISVTGYDVEVYNADAFAVGVSVVVNGNGDIVQTYEDIVIRVPSANLTAYRALPGFSFYYSSIVGVTSFSHTLP